MKKYNKNHPSYLPLIVELITELNTSGVTYCHWKSNAMLDLSGQGENDIDLLVSRSDVQEFFKILSERGFKLATDVSWGQMPGVLDFYGYDNLSDRFVHVHAHFRLVIGHDATKNYHLPLETTLLKSKKSNGLFHTPTLEFEFIIFVIRMTLKHSTWDAILFRQGSLSISESNEMEYLCKKVTLAIVEEIVKLEFPFIGNSLFDRCIRSLQPGISFWYRIRTANMLQSRLRTYSRRSHISDLWLKISRFFISVIRYRFTKKTNKKRLASGGLLVAVVGGDGSGKTTAVQRITSWLSDQFGVMHIHLGKPPWSFLTIVVRGILKIGRSIRLYPFIREPIQYSLDSSPHPFPGYPWALREVCTARDRYIAYSKARRYVANGGLVICDRYPLPMIRLMDGPQIQRMISNKKSNFILDFLIKLENKYYQKILEPDLLFVLKVDPDIAVLRKQDEDADTVHPRSSEIWRIDWIESDAHILDASRSKDEVINDLKYLIWSEL